MTALEEVVVNMAGSMMIHIAARSAQITADLAPVLIMESAGALCMTAMPLTRPMIVQGVLTMVTGVLVTATVVTGGKCCIIFAPNHYGLLDFGIWLIFFFFVNS